jgi:hypothetical protein
VACKQQASEIVTYLLAKGANRDAADKNQKILPPFRLIFQQYKFENSHRNLKKLTFWREIKEDIYERLKLEKENWSLRRQLHEVEKKYFDLALQMGSMPNPLETGTI